MPVRVHYRKRPTFQEPEFPPGPSTRAFNELIRFISYIWLPLLIFLVPFVYYWPVIGSGFVSDDFFYHWIFIWDISDYIEQISLIYQGHSSYPFFRPVVLFSFQIDYLLWGLNAVGFHFTNLFIHSINAVLLYYLARVLGIKEFGAAICALFFGLYPANPEVVTWISGRFDLMTTMFTLLALHAWCAARLKNNLRWMAPALICYLLAMLSKENGVAAVMLLPLVDWLLHVRTRREWGQGVGFLWKWYIIWGAVLITYLGFRLWLFHGSMGGYRDENNQVTFANFPLSDLWEKVICGDFWMMLTPISRILWPEWEMWLQIVLIATGVAALTGLIAALVYAILQARRSNEIPVIQISTALIWIIVLFLPVMPIGRVFGSLDYARFLYFPLTGFALLIGVVSCIGWESRRNLKVLTTVVVIALLIFSGLTLRRHNETWIEAGEIATYMHSVMETYTSTIPEATIIFAANFPWLHKGAHCAPIGYEGYVAYKYGISRVDTWVMNWEPEDTPGIWEGLSSNYNRPGIGFVWNDETDSLSVLPLFIPAPRDTASLESLMGIEIIPPVGVPEITPEPTLPGTEPEDVVTEVDVLPEPV